MAEKTLDHPLIERQGEPLLPPSDSGRARLHAIEAIDWRQGIGMALVVAGVVAVIGAYVGVSGTSNTADQLSYMTSGGLGGVVLLAAGVVFFSAYEHRRDRSAMEGLTERLLHLEDGLAGEFDHLYKVMGNGTRQVAEESRTR
jgi:hypothetical protein